MTPTVMTAPVMTTPIPGSADAVQAMSHLGPLGDADLAKELAQLTALQNRQAVGGDSPSALNRAPQTLLSLFSQA
jgi:flagellin-like hook-associated protein FlgL